MSEPRVLKIADRPIGLAYVLLVLACVVVPLKIEQASSALIYQSGVPAPVTTVTSSVGYGVVFNSGSALIDLDRWFVQFVAVWLVCLWLNRVSPWPMAWERSS